jgi:hypothetical protein
MPTKESIERVARRICQASGFDPDRDVFGSAEEKLENGPMGTYFVPSSLTRGIRPAWVCFAEAATVALEEGEKDAALVRSHSV